ncbi:MAG: flagellar hook basal-body protein [Calditrichaeota bacterium]|nr:MAG: flagellar hook basal-body protein [Calditrichota bacterium]MBL1204032.1 flagellar hook basal-body protein [Calditrichota bacterium]NOG43863.1 flagellar hook basal-body protein [Calditrichota bacterium]
MQFELTKLKQAMMAQVDRNNNAANNMANIGTTGFKKDQIFFHTLSDELDISKDMTHATSFEQGHLQETGNPFDLALSGNGFFMVELENGDNAFTRDGVFHVDEDGVLKNKSNMPVLGEGGWINILSEFGTPSDVVITERGEVFADGNLLDKIIVADFETPDALQKMGGSLFKANERAVEFQVDTPSIKQGFLEGSNVNPAQEMIELIEIQRNFEGVQRMVRALDDVYKKAVQQVGQYRTTA